jgi:amino acid adenylation domain-containing protein
LTEFSTPDYLNRSTNNGSLAAQHSAVPAFSLLNVKNDIELSQLREKAADVCHAKPEDVQDIYPCTVVQESLFALSVKSPHMYVARYLYKLPQDIDLDRFYAAFQTAIEAHTILRTRVIQIETGEALQVVIRQGIDCPYWENLRDYLDQDLQKTTELSAPLVRAGVAKHEDGDYYFVFTLHHATYDDWALALFMKHIESAYHDIALPSQPFSRFTQYCLESGSEIAKEFWREELTEKKMAPTTFPVLPSDTYSPAATKSLIQNTDFEVQLDFDHASSVIELAWAVMMAQYTDSDEVVFGVTDTGKRAQMPDMALMSGPTIATFPLQIRVQWGQSIREARENLHNRRTQIVPFEQLGLHNISRLSADAAAICRFQSLLVLQPPRRDDYELFNEVTSEFQLENHATFGTYPITLVIEPGPTSVSVQAVYDDKIVPEAQMQRILQQHAHLMKWISQHPDLSVRDIPALCPEDHKQLQQWNLQSAPQETFCIHDLISQRCSSQPEAPAVCAWDGEFSYRELDSISTTFAAHLQRKGHIQPDVIVPLYFEKSRWTAIAILAVIKAGGAFVLLDPSTPFKRLQGICEDTNAPFVIAPPGLASRAEELIGKVVMLDDKAIVYNLADYAPSPVRPNNILYIVFTSGSTGKPKGVVIEHGAFCASALAYTSTAKMSPETRALQFASYAFDVSVTDHLATLLAGGCICIPSPEDRMNRIADIVSEFQINYADFTPSFLRSLSPEDFPTLKTIILGGEAMSRTDIETWCSRVRLLNIYGPAECCVLSTIQPDVATQQDPLDIGSATGGVCWIVDKSDHTRLVPIGGVGELLVGGPIVGRGYLNDPEKTAQAFVPQPAWLGEGEASGRVYKTGDLVQYTSSGSIRFLGRKDMQVKLRGQRIELGEVEYYLRQCFPSALEIVAEVVKPRVQNTAILTAFVLKPSSQFPQEDPLMLPDEVFQAEQAQAELQLRDQLPSYMIPSVFIRLSQLPLTATGKTNRKLLRERLSDLSPAEFEQYTSLGTEKRRPANDQEHLVHMLVTRQLGLSSESVGMQDSLFRIGGDSITAIKLTSIMGSHGWKLTVADIFSNPRLEDMARVMKQKANTSLDSIQPFSLIGKGVSVDGQVEAAGTQDKVPPPIKESLSEFGITSLDNVEDIYPSRGFQGFNLSRYDREIGYNHVCVIFELQPVDDSEPIDPVRVQKAWGQLVARHPMMRTVYVPDLSSLWGYVLVVLKQAVPNFEIIQSSDSQVLATLRQHVAKDYPSDKSLPHRLTLTQTESGKVFALLEMHHGFVDGLTMPIIEADMRALYSESQLPAIPLYRDFIATALQGSKSVNRSYWTEYLKDAPKSVYLPDSSMTGYPGKAREIEIPLASLESIKDFARSQSSTTPTLFRALWAVVLRILVNSQDVTFYYISSARYSSGIETKNMIGSHIEMLMARLRAAEHVSFAEMLSIAQEDYSQSMPHQFASIDTVEELGLWNHFNTVYNYRLCTSNNQSTENESAFHWKQHEVISDSPVSYPTLFWIFLSRQNMYLLT